MESRPTNKLKACGVLVARSDVGDPMRLREFLLMKHPTRWDLPKGHVDPGEEGTEIVTALRELEEETEIPADAIEIDPGFRFEIQYQVKSKRTGGELRWKTLVIFLGRLQSEVTISVSEHEGYRWFPWSPPHRIQEQTIDPLLAEVERYLARSDGWQSGLFAGNG